MYGIEFEISGLIQNYRKKTGEMLTIGSIESATGGRIGDKITNVPGSSDYFKGSIVAYSNEIKEHIIGVTRKTLEHHGAVSSEIAIEMALRGKKLLEVAICVSDTGIAGPTGVMARKPAGLFYLGLATNQYVTSNKYNFDGNREQNKQCATESALLLLKESLQTCLDQASSELPEEKHVVTCFLENNKRILILKRSAKVGSYQGKWAGISGYLEVAEPLAQVFVELKEEAGLNKNKVELLGEGIPLEVLDNKLKLKWIVHPFLMHVKNPHYIKTDWEHIEMKWIEINELSNYETVPGLKDAFDRIKLYLV